LLLMLNRRFPGVLKVDRTLIRSVLGSLACAGIASLVLFTSWTPPVQVALALALGGLVAIPFIWPEIKLLVKL
jgi:hypothetical protein